MKTNRRSLFKKMTATLAGLMGIQLTKASANTPMEKDNSITMEQNVPLFSGNRTFEMCIRDRMWYIRIIVRYNWI